MFRMIGGTITFLVLVLGVAIWRFSMGPVPMKFLTAPLQEAFNRLEAPVKINVAQTALAWNNREGMIEVVAYDVSIMNEDSQVVAKIPAAGFLFSLASLIEGNFIPVSLNIIQPKLKIIRTEEGKFQLDIPLEASTGDAEEGNGSFLALLESLSSEEGGAIPGLKTLQVTQGTLGIEDRVLHLTWKARDLNLVFRKKEEGFIAQSSMHVSLPKQDLVVAATIVQRKGESDFLIEGGFQGLNAANVAALTDSLRALEGFDLSLEGRLGFVLGADLKIKEAKTKIRGRDGAFKASPTSTLAPIRRFALDASIPVDENQKLSLDRLFIELRQGHISAEGLATIDTSERTRLEGSVQIRDLPLSLLRSYWPKDVASNPREWAVKNIVDGTLTESSTKFSLSVGGLDMEDTTVEELSGQMSFVDGVVTYFGDLPPVKDATGTVSFDQATLRANVKSGTLGSMAVRPSTIEIKGLDSSDQTIRIDAIVHGDASSALKILDSNPLNYPKKLGLDPESVKGSVQVKAFFDFPLLADLPMEKVRLGASAELTDVSVKKAVGEWGLTGGRLALSVDPLKMEINGTAALNGVPLTLKWTEDFRDDAAYATRIDASGQTDDEDRARFGVDFYPYVTGRVPVALTYEVKQSGKPAMLNITADLADSFLQIPPLDFSQNAGPGSKATATLLIDGASLSQIQKFSVSALGMTASGSGLFGKDSALTKLTVASVKGPDMDIKIEWEKDKNGIPRISAEGPKFNLGALMGEAKVKLKEPKKDEKTSSPLHFSAYFDHVELKKDKRIHQLVGSGTRTKEGWETVDLNAWTVGGQPLVIRYAPEGNIQTLSIESSDAGAVFSLLGITDSIKGGMLTAQGKSRSDDSADTIFGHMEIKTFDVYDAPGLAKLLSALSFEGWGSLLDDGQAIRFDKLTSDFRWDDIGVAFADGKTAGGALGLTFEGRVDLENDTADLQGTIVPFSGLNNFLSAIPLLGPLLTGGEGQGLFAATYAIEGPLKDPKISINPLAALTPGFLRNLFFMDAPTDLEKTPD